MRFGIHMPAWRRRALLCVVLDHLRRVDRAIRADGHELDICVAGSEGEELAACVTALGARYVEVPNAPLSDKINAAVEALRGRNPDALVGIGSDDLVTAAMFRRWAELLLSGSDYVGALDGYYYDAQTGRLLYWRGYPGARVGEVLGPGRCISSALAERLGWKPFPPGLRCNLDGGFERQIAGLGRPVCRTAVRDPEVSICDVKTAESMNKASDGVPVNEPARWLGATYGTETAAALLRVVGSL